jgi:hypothetical protein
MHGAENGPASATAVSPLLPVAAFGRPGSVLRSPCAFLPVKPASRSSLSLPGSGCLSPDHLYRIAVSGLPLRMPRRYRLQARSVSDSPPCPVSRAGRVSARNPLPAHSRRSVRLLASRSRSGPFDPFRSTLAAIRRPEACLSWTCGSLHSPPTAAFDHCCLRINASSPGLSCPAYCSVSWGY